MIMSASIYFTLLVILLLTPVMAYAVCPVCTVAVIGGLGISRYLGIDDTVTGLWIGGLILSSGLWLADWIGRKNWKVPYKEVVSVLLFMLLVVPPLYWAGLLGIPGNTLHGVDKLLLGMVTGSIVFVGAVQADKWLRVIHGGNVYVYFQKVIIPVLLLSIASFILYRVTR